MPAALAKAIPATMTGAVAHRAMDVGLVSQQQESQRNMRSTRRGGAAPTAWSPAQEVICDSFHHSMSAIQKWLREPEV